MKTFSASTIWTTIYFFVATLFFVPDAISQGTRTPQGGRGGRTGTVAPPARTPARAPTTRTPAAAPTRSGTRVTATQTGAPRAAQPAPALPPIPSTNTGILAPLPGTVVPASVFARPSPIPAASTTPGGKCKLEGTGEATGITAAQLATMSGETLAQYCCIIGGGETFECQKKAKEANGGKTRCDETSDKVTEALKEYGSACGKMGYGVNTSNCAERMAQCGAETEGGRSSRRSSAGDMLSSAVRGLSNRGGSCPWVLAKGIEDSRGREEKLKDSTRELQKDIFDSQNDSMKREQDATQKISELHEKIRNAETTADNLNLTLQAKLAELSKVTGDNYTALVQKLKELRAKKSATQANEVNKRQRSFYREKTAVEGDCRKMGQEAVNNEQRKRAGLASGSQLRVAPTDIWKEAGSRNANFQRIGLEAYYACMENNPDGRQRMVDKQLELESEVEDLRTQTELIEAEISTVEAQITDLQNQEQVQKNLVFMTVANEYKKAQQAHLAYQQELANFSQLAAMQRQQSQMQAAQLQAQYQQELTELNAVKARNDYAGSNLTDADFEAFQTAAGERGKAESESRAFRENCCENGKLKVSGSGERYCKEPDELSAGSRRGRR